jgi:predicted nucleotide-binding protein (sugar kinase/HSP70/actin superfamily)
VTPAKNNKRTLQIGAEYSPEEICLPFKMMMGNFIEGIEKGADTILTTGSCGPCRFGEYCELQMKILRKIGYEDIDFIVADLSSEVGTEEFNHRMGKVGAASPVSRTAQFTAIRDAYRTVKLCDKIDASAYYLAGYERTPGECKRILHEYKDRLLECENPEETLKLLNDYKRKINSVKIDCDKDPIKISIIGEIFTVIDPYSNLYIEEKLMDYGVSSIRKLTPSWWTKDLMLKPFKLNSLDIKRASRKYLPYSVGGHGKECIGEAVLAKNREWTARSKFCPLDACRRSLQNRFSQRSRWTRIFP